MPKAPELYLVKSMTAGDNARLFAVLDDILQTDSTPSVRIGELWLELAAAGQPFDLLIRLESVKQSPVHHPEGDVLRHTLLVTDAAARVRAQASDPRVFMWAALLHDVGKLTATRERGGKITAYDHDREGEKLARRFLQMLTDDGEFIEAVTALVRFHMHPLYVEKKLPFADMRALRRRTVPRDVMLLGLCDRLGRTDADEAAERKKAEVFLKNAGG